MRWRAAMPPVKGDVQQPNTIAQLSSTEPREQSFHALDCAPYTNSTTTRPTMMPKETQNAYFDIGTRSSIAMRA